MSIECSPSSQAGQVTGGASAGAASGRSANTSASQQSGGFSSLLQGLGETVSDAATPSSAGAADGSTSPTDASPPAPTSSEQTESQARPLTKTQAQTPDAAMQALLVQFLSLAASPPVQPTAATVPDSVPSSAPAMRPQAAGSPLQAGSAFTLPAGAVGGPGVDTALGHASAMRWLPKADAIAVAPTDQATTATATNTQAWSIVGTAPGGQAAGLNEQETASWQSTITTHSAPQELQAGAISRDAAQQSLSQPASDFVRAAAVTGLVASLSGSESGVSARKRGAAAATNVGVDVPSASGLGSVASGSPAGSVSASSAAAPGQGVEQAVAEQVKYWISNDVHNAQLKFDGLGSASVQVSISMSGNQAQVVFQSDQAHTRALLGNAMTQLDQMLRGEGLTLTSAWVASSGQQGQFGANSQSHQPTSALPPAATQAPTPVPAPASPSAPSDRVVDLFV